MLSSPTNFRVMNSKNTALGCITLAALFIGIMAIMTIDSVYANSKNKGTSTQQNSCGNDDLTMNIICQNVDSKDHGRDNTVIVNSTQPQ
jgi:hypothetical protein